MEWYQVDLIELVKKEVPLDTDQNLHRFKGINFPMPRCGTINHYEIRDFIEQP
jgi:hypothetical protein